MELTQREKAWLAIAILVLTPLLFVRWVLIPLNDYSRQQRIAVSRAESKIKEIEMMGQQLQHLERNRNMQTGLLSEQIERLLQQNQLRDRSRTIVDTGSDSQQRLVLKLDDVNLTELVKLLYAIENALPAIAIKNIEIDRAFTNKKRFRVSASLVSW